MPENTSLAGFRFAGASRAIKARYLSSRAALLLLFKLGVSAKTLHRIYYARRNQTSAPIMISKMASVANTETGMTR
jgi:hypothetical protein